MRSVESIGWHVCQKLQENRKVSCLMVSPEADWGLPCMAGKLSGEFSLFPLLITFPAIFLIDFLRKLADKIANDNHMIMGRLATLGVWQGNSHKSNIEYCLQTSLSYWLSSFTGWEWRVGSTVKASDHHRLALLVILGGIISLLEMGIATILSSLSY